MTAFLNRESIDQIVSVDHENVMSFVVTTLKGRDPSVLSRGSDGSFI